MLYNYSVELVGMQSVYCDHYEGEGNKTCYMDGVDGARYYDPPSVMFPEAKTTPKLSSTMLALYGWDERKKLSREEAKTLQSGLTGIGTSVEAGTYTKLGSLRQRPPEEVISNSNNRDNAPIAMAVAGTGYSGLKGKKSFDLQNQRRYVQKFYYKRTPHFTCNLATLQALMLQNKSFKFTATQFCLDDGTTCIKLKYNYPIKKWTSRVVADSAGASNSDGPEDFGKLAEKFLSVGFEGEEKNTRFLEALYLTTLNGPGGPFTIGLKGEADGIWNASRTRESRGYSKRLEVEPDDIVEVKTLQDRVFNRRATSTHSDTYYYEEVILRRYWAHCRLRGIHKLLCAVHTGLTGHKGSEVVTDLLVYNVDSIPGLLTKNKKYRLFPNDIGPRSRPETRCENVTNSKPHTWTEWSEQSEFKKLYAALDSVFKSFNGSKPKTEPGREIETKYFICAKKSPREVTKAEYRRIIPN